MRFCEKFYLCTKVEMMRTIEKTKTAKTLAGANQKRPSKKAQEIKNALEKAKEISYDLMQQGKFIPFSKNLIYGNQ